MTHKILILTEEELRQSVPLDLTAIETVQQAFIALASGGVVMPPIMSMEIPCANGEVDVKTAYLPGFDGFAVKISPGFFDNPKLGLPSTSGLMVLFSTRTGQVEAVLLDNGYLTDVRTAAAGAVAARYLAPQQVNTAGVIGSGVQARLQIKAAHQVRPFNKVLVWGRDQEKAKACAEDLSRIPGVDVKVESDPSLVVEGAQLVVTTTPSGEPVLKAEWLHPGLHITAMGSDQATKNEIEAEAIAKADLYVVDRVSQCERLGELRAAREAGFLINTVPPELGQIISGMAPGRVDDDQITICDLTGTGAQDTAIATFARKAAVAADSGTGIFA
ncbi:MAG: cyclodeaminase [bacterium]